MGVFNFLRSRPDKTRDDTGIQKTTETGDSQETRPVELKVSDALAWFNREISNRLTHANYAAFEMQNEIYDNIETIKESVRILASAGIDVAADKRLKTSAEMVRKSFVNRVHALTSRARPSRDSNLSDADFEKTKQLYLDTSVIVRDLMQMSPKQITLLSRFFKKETLPLIKEIERMDRIVSDFGGFLTSDAKIIKHASDMKTRFEDYSNFSKKHQFLLSEERNTLNKITELEGRAKNLEREKESITSGSEWKDAERIFSEMQSAKQRAAEIRSDIRAEVSSINKTLKKLDHALQEGKGISSPDHTKRLIRGFIESPFQTIMEDGADKRLKSLLEQVSRLVKEKRIVVKPKELEKMFDVMRKLHTQIPWLRERYEKLLKIETKRAIELKEQYGEIFDRKLELDNETEKINKQINDLRESVSGMRQSAAEIDSLLRQCLSEIGTEMSSITGKKVMIAA